MVTLITSIIKSGLHTKTLISEDISYNSPVLITIYMLIIYTEKVRLLLSNLLAYDIVNTMYVIYSKALPRADVHMLEVTSTFF